MRPASHSRASRSNTGVGLLFAVLALTACTGPELKTNSVHYEGDRAAAKRALVVYGTRAGSTAEVADFVGKRLSESGWSVDVEAVQAVKNLDRYQAVVIGSAIRRGSVLPEVREFVKSQKAALQKTAVAYFVVCMAMREDTLEHRAKAESYLDPLRAEVKPIEVGLFAGAVDYAKLEGGSKMMARMVKLPAGDFRDWTAIGAWVDSLAAKLQGAF
jgi:menaquinone-dependent protoporphyrinogen oxidase